MYDILIPVSILTHENEFINTFFEFYQKIMGKFCFFYFVRKNKKQISRIHAKSKKNAKDKVETL